MKVSAEKSDPWLSHTDIMEEIFKYEEDENLGSHDLQ